MLYSLKSLGASKSLRYDVCIIGTGAAGLTLAHQLRNTKLRVCLLESGGETPRASSQRLNKAESVGIEYDVEESRSRGLGGTLRMWQGTVAPFDPVDFEHRDWIPASGWPIRHNDLRSGYEEAYRILGIAEHAHNFDGLKDDHKSEIDRFGVDRSVFDTKPFIMLKMQVDRLCKTLLKQCLDASNIDCLTDATVTELIQEPVTGRVMRARMRSQGTLFERTIAAKTFVIATGGLEAPRLLLASRNERGVGLGNDRDLVGRYFMDHPRLRSTAVNLPDRRRAPILENVALGLCGMKSAFVPKTELQKQRRLANNNFFISPVGVDLERKAMKAVAKAEQGTAKEGGKKKSAKSAKSSGPSIRVRGMQQLRRLWRMTPVRLRVGAMGLMSQRSIKRFGFVLKIEQSPNPDSRITLSDQVDELGMPKLRLDWRLNDTDHQNVDGMHDLIKTSFGAQGFDTEGLDFRSPDGTYTYQDSSHPMGATRMSDGPSTGVVDANCAVFGHPNVFVCSSSVFSTGGNANATLTIMALAVRLAEKLKSDAVRPVVVTTPEKTEELVPATAETKAPAPLVDA